MDFGEIIILFGIGGIAWFVITNKAAKKDDQIISSAKSMGKASVAAVDFGSGMAGVPWSGSDSAPGSSVTSQGDQYDNLDNFLQGIYQMEGGNPGDPNVRNNNPGNIRIPGTSRDVSYNDMGDGWDSLNGYVVTHAKLNPEWDFYDFFNYYLRGKTDANPVDAQGDSNKYAEYVANYMGVDPTTPVSSLFPLNDY